MTVLSEPRDATRLGIALAAGVLVALVVGAVFVVGIPFTTDDQPVDEAPGVEMAGQDAFAGEDETSGDGVAADDARAEGMATTEEGDGEGGTSHEEGEFESAGSDTHPANEDGHVIDAVELDDFEPSSPETTPGRLVADHNDFAEFRDVAAEVGLEYDVGEGTPHFPDVHGPYVVDFNNNGYEDLLLVGGENPVLFENVGGEYERYRVFEHPNTVTAHFFDYDNDGYRDLLLAKRGEPPVFYENRGGAFEQRDVGFDQSTTYPTAITSADFTGNGCLDVYVGSWAGFGQRAMTLTEMTEVGRNHPEVRPTTDAGGPNLLFSGDCETFEEVGREAGVRGAAFTLAVSAADFTGNGHLDIHVGNDFTGDYIYENQGDGTFEAIDLGPASDRNAMSSVAIDATGNHHLDVFVTNVYYEDVVTDVLVPITQTPLPDGNNLFVNEGDGEFRDVAPEHGIHRGSWGWAATLADYTNDGHLDIIHASSYVTPTVVGDHPDVFRPPQVWKGTAESWEKVHGFDLGFPEHNLRGVARVDYANDGVLDFVAVSTPSAPPRAGIRPDEGRVLLYENTHDNDQSLQLFVRNPNGLDQHSEVYVETDERTIYRVVNARGDFLSQDSRLIHVGTGNEVVERVTVVWPDGTATGYGSLTDGNRYILTPDGATAVPRPEREESDPEG